MYRRNLYFLIANCGLFVRISSLTANFFVHAYDVNIWFVIGIHM